MMRRCARLAAAVALRCWRPRARRRRRSRDWPSERPPRPLPARDVKFPPYQIQTLPTACRSIAVSHHEQPAVSMRLLVRAGGAQDPADKPGVAALAASLLDQGTTTKTAEQIADDDRFDRRRDGRRRRHRPDLHQCVVMKDSFDVGARHGVRHGAASGVRARGDRAAAAADAVGAARSATTIRTTSPTRCSIGSSTASIPTACPDSGTPESIAGDHARRSASRSTSASSRRTTPSSPSSAT